MSDKKISHRVETEINLMILEVYEGMNIESKLRKRIMVFVKKAIMKTLNYKNEVGEQDE